MNAPECRQTKANAPDKRMIAHKSDTHQVPIIGMYRTRFWLAPRLRQITNVLPAAVRAIGASLKALAVGAYCHGLISRDQLSDVFARRPEWRSR
jgi:hypothetical protein